MLQQLHLSLCTVVKLHISHCACFPLKTANESCCLQYRLPVADLPPAAARQSLRFFCASEENQPGNIFRAPGIAILATLSSRLEEHVFICAACWELLCILQLPLSTNEIVIIITAHTRITFTKLKDHVAVLANLIYPYRCTPRDHQGASCIICPLPARLLLLLGIARRRGALLAAPFLPVLGLVLRGHNLQLPQPWCPSHRAAALTDVSLALPWDMLACVTTGAQGTAKPVIKLKLLGNQQAGISTQSGKTKVKKKRSSWKV